MTFYLHTFLLFFPLTLLLPVAVMAWRTVQEIPNEEGEGVEEGDSAALRASQRSEKRGSWTRGPA